MFTWRNAMVLNMALFKRSCLHVIHAPVSITVSTVFTLINFTHEYSDVRLFALFSLHIPYNSLDCWMSRLFIIWLNSHLLLLQLIFFYSLTINYIPSLLIVLFNNKFCNNIANYSYHATRNSSHWHDISHVFRITIVCYIIYQTISSIYISLSGLYFQCLTCHVERYFTSSTPASVGQDLVVSWHGCNQDSESDWRSLFL